MEPLEFMAAVLPPPGNGRYCAVELTNKKEHVYVEELDQLSGPINRWNDDYERVLLGGLTCDSDDYYNSEQHSNAIYLPKFDKNKSISSTITPPL